MKMLLIIMIFFAPTAMAQVQGEKLDSLLRPAKTDSADFSNSGYKKDPLSVPTQSQPARHDTLPMDDRKPKGPPKK
jgi:hypothetical protein